MDLTFHCSNCKQELAVDSTAAGTVIQCPTCNAHVTVPHADATNIHLLNTMASSAAAKIERHFSVPAHDAPAEILLQVPTHAEEEVVADGDKKVKVKIFRHTDCVEVGRDRYEELVGAFLNKVGEPNIISIGTMNYTHIDIATQKILSDYAVQIIYRG